MDGRPITGRNVPLLDKQNLWTLFMDPYSFLWRSTFSIVGSLRAHATEMIAFFVPHHAPRYQLRRVALLEEFEVSIITNSFCNNIYECTFSPNQINDCVFISICRSFGHTLDAGPIFGTCQFQMMSAWKKRIFATGTLIWTRSRIGLRSMMESMDDSVSSRLICHFPHCTKLWESHCSPWKLLAQWMSRELQSLSNI